MKSRGSSPRKSLPSGLQCFQKSLTLLFGAFIFFFLGKKQKVKYINCSIIYLANVIIYMKLWLCEYICPFSVSAFMNINNRKRKEGKIRKH